MRYTDITIVIVWHWAGSRLDARDQYGCTALYFAAKHGHPHVVRQLISAGADLNIADTKGYTPLASEFQTFLCTQIL